MLHDRVPTARDPLIGPFNFVFICVPTPMFLNGSANTRFVDEAVSKVCSAAQINPDIEPPVVVIKSTVPPGMTQRLNEYYSTELNGKFQLVFNPEFLTEANYLADFRNQTHLIVGGPRPASSKLKQMYTLPFPEAHIVKTDSTYAELVKYMTNCFLATKVSFANDMKRVCDHFGVDYDKVMEYAVLDPRLGKTHWNVPGPDGHMGFGGSCFPKDMNAFMAICRQQGISIPTICGAWETNLQVRPERDWEQLKGRAVTND
jgi:UDPglucose 6-dehydrogenase